MLKIKKINWISESAKEAEVLLTDGTFDILCYSQPFEYDIENHDFETIYLFSVSNILIIDNERKSLVKKLNNSYDYEFSGEVIERNNNRIRVGEFVLELDFPLPKDIKEGEYVSLYCERVDIY
ncbi:hypothetical protein [Flavivirga sp. 57AJ16]|uniref:hypothetical protein n=1 Tax=Flavivirga sp. 57AJ16 TaxID=3025307 RepID=UPI002365011C|nr:hypothetical protein [Flavivirga sp. 57AJ16]MDD7886036.1 hypothetical protein [Flavivirga sp. 57AJ16]